MTDAPSARVARISRAELESFRDAAIPEFMPASPALVFVGINPGLYTAATGTPFAHPGNRFFPALVRAGVIPRMPRISRDGMAEQDRRMLFDRGIGITNFVNRATARADELSRDEMRAGAERLVRNLRRWRPRVVAVVGVTAYRQGFDRPKASAGRQDDPLAGAELWVVPNPSGLNAHDTIGSLAEKYAAPARAAGVVEAS